MESRALRHFVEKLELWLFKIYSANNKKCRFKLTETGFHEQAQGIAVILEGSGLLVEKRENKKAAIILCELLPVVDVLVHCKNL
jgi:hypothetical protein